MRIKLTSPMPFKGSQKRKGDVIDVHPSLGEKLIEQGHKKTDEAPVVKVSSDILSDEKVDALPYKDLKALVFSMNIKTDDAKSDTLKVALKSHFATLRL